MGEEEAGRITGMLIGLPENELTEAVSTWDTFSTKVIRARQMLKIHQMMTKKGGQNPEDEQGPKEDE